MNLTTRIAPAGHQFTTFRHFLLVYLLFFSSLWAQPLGERVGPQFPFLASSARATAMGDASHAIVDDFSGFGSNPSVLGLLKKNLIDYSTLRVQKGITFEHLGVSYQATTVDAIGFGIEILHFGGTDFYANEDVRKLGFELRTGLIYGRSFSDDLSAGMNLQILTATTGPNSVWAFVGDIGLTYIAGKYTRYGFSLKGLGSDYSVAASLLHTDVASSRIAKVVAASVVFDYPFSDQSQKIVLAIQNEKILGETGLIYKIGMEYFPFWSPTFRFAARCGTLIRERFSEPRFGLGTSYSQFSFDYAYRYSLQDSQPSHLFTLGVSW